MHSSFLALLVAMTTSTATADMFGHSFANAVFAEFDAKVSSGDNSTIVAQELIDKLNAKVMPLIDQLLVNDTNLATRYLNQLAISAKKVVEAHANLTKPDAAMDTCHVEENATLHAWKMCNHSLIGLKSYMDTHCAAMAAAGVSDFNIDVSQNLGIDYSQGLPKPSAVCDFETFTLEGTDQPCNSFVADITTDAKSKWDTDYVVFTTEEEACTTGTENFINTTSDCARKGQIYREKEAECTGLEGDLDLKLCHFQNVLKKKCTDLSLFDAAIANLYAQEEERNTEYRTVSTLKCLLNTYTKGEQCFDDTRSQHCDKLVDGAAKRFSTDSAQGLHNLTVIRDGHNALGALSCSAQTVQVGDDVSYKADAAVLFSYYAKFGPFTVKTSVSGMLSPDMCA